MRRPLQRGPAMRYAVGLLALAAVAQSIEAPRVGTVLGNDGVWRVLHGVAGNFTLGDEVAEDAPAVPDRVQRSAGGVFIADEHGGMVDALPQATGAVLPVGDAVVYVAGDELVLRRADHSEMRFALAGVTLLRSIGHDYVQAGGHALRLSTGQLYVLPQPAAQGRRR